MISVKDYVTKEQDLDGWNIRVRGNDGMWHVVATGLTFDEAARIEIAICQAMILYRRERIKESGATSLEQVPVEV